ncbi:MAG: MliC family protein [Ramlibacter sp.]
MKTCIATILCATALLSGCASGPGPETLEGHAACTAPALPAAPRAGAAPAPLLARVWLCSDRRTVTLYPKAEGADILDRGCQMPLARVAAASGVRYENQAVVFIDKGGEALLQRKPGQPLACREITLMSQIEDARIRGVTWRGHGVGGDWHIDVGPGPGLTLVRAGVAPLVFSRPTSVSDPNTNTTVYSARQGNSTLRLKLTDLQCRDKAGNTLPGSVDAELDGVTLEGCGVPLSR